MQKVKLGDICKKASSNIAQKDLENKSGKYPIYGAAGLIKTVDFYQQSKAYLAIVKDGAGVGRVMKLPANSSIISTMQGIIPNDNVEISYLFYLLTYMDLAKFWSGSTIPHIYFKDYKNEEIILPQLKEQIEIAKKLDKVVDLIEKRKKQIEKLDELVRSRFIEMFGAIGKKIKDWNYEPISCVCEINPKKSENKTLQNDTLISFVPMPAVTETGDIDVSETKLYKDVKNGFTYFCDNDVLFAKITPCMENGKGAIAKNLRNGIGFGSTEFHVLRPIKGVSNSEWIYFITVFVEFRLAAEKMMTGSAGQRRVPVVFFDKFKVAVPPIELQNKFAEFVEKVEKTKPVIKKSLSALETLKKSLMQKYFG